MTNDATYQAVGAGETTGRWIVTFRQDATEEGVKLLTRKAGVRSLVRSRDFDDKAVNVEDVESDGGAVFEEIGVAVMSLEPDAKDEITAAATEDSAIESVEPERVLYALEDDSLAYLRGYWQGLRGYYDALVAEAGEQAPAVAERRCYDDDDESTWGLKATNVLASKYSGRGISVAVLDTGLDLQHPDFTGRSVTHRSFISGEVVDDKNGHGTHCIGKACGPRTPASVRGYGVAYDARIFAGKVLSNGGSGNDGGILAGINWAVSNGCQIISMSLGAPVRQPSHAYERVGERALEAGSLIIAAAGNNRQIYPPHGFVGRPANSRSIMAVAALDRCLQIADFSARSSPYSGGEVDIAGPGVNVFSAWPLDVAPRGYRSISGTSMATPHVSGIAALFAEAYRARGFQLWQLLTSHARRLPLPSVDVGSGLVIAP